MSTIKNEYKHIVKCIKDLNTLERGSRKWYDKFLWIRERNRSSWMIGLIDLKQYTKISKYLDKLEKTVKKELSESTGAQLSR